jgi:hypothetical protein
MKVKLVVNHKLAVIHFIFLYFSAAALQIFVWLAYYIQFVVFRSSNKGANYNSAYGYI